eukprot:TRINITY_DN52057_c0_g1_i1.p2 TRINITY_DN52057_c0_g1~~TRINITY_DN52057_c0_g1_i1.p2  ORF type:complete len:117 (+),score=8.36 TRINITY_DN52057_c0_g1_i1:207-557(+)
MSKEQQEALFGNTARAMGDAPEMIKIRHIGNCLKADPVYGEGVAKALGIDLSKVTKQIIYGRRGASSSASRLKASCRVDDQAAVAFRKVTRHDAALCIRQVKQMGFILTNLSLIHI